MSSFSTRHWKVGKRYRVLTTPKESFSISRINPKKLEMKQKVFWITAVSPRISSFPKRNRKKFFAELEGKILEDVPYYSPLCCFSLKPRRSGGVSLKRDLVEKFFKFEPAVSKEEVRLYTLVRMRSHVRDGNVRDKLPELVDFASERLYTSPFCWFSLNDADLEKRFWRKVKFLLRFKPVNINKVYFILDCIEDED
ncbi:hypothetical protein JTB14_015798 [Gonioctena quinquepunctata]|nr:hypothetical protein JTB14_015798 [Gonioctena quinquepunctata]